MEEKVYQAKTLGDAITDACAELGVTSDKLDYKVIQEGKNGFFGFGAKPFIISVKVKSEKAASQNNTRQDAKNGKPQREKNSEKKDFKENSGRKNDQKQGGAQNDQEKKPANVRDENKENKNDRKKDRGERTERGERPERNNQNRNGKKKFNRDGNKPDQSGKDSAEKKSERFADGKNVPVREKNAENRPERPEKSERPLGKVTGDPVKVAEDFLKGLFQSMEADIAFKGEFNNETNELKIDLSGDDTSIFIGKRGQTLDALQYLTSQVVNKHQTAYIRVKLDTENYRERRKDTMETLAKNVAQKVKRTKKPVALEPMNPYERRIIHSVLQGDKDIITRSEGVEPYRHVVVCPVRKRRNEKSVIPAETAAKTTENIPSADELAENAKLKAEAIAADAMAKADSIADTVENAAAKASVKVDSIAEATENKAEEIAKAAEKKAGEFEDAAEIKADAITEAVDAKEEAISEQIEKAADVINEAGEAVKETVTETFSEIK